MKAMGAGVKGALRMYWRISGVSELGAIFARL
jgi:hypothetical protein